MTVRHHISDEILMSYAAGSLTEGWSLLVATHLALCPRCRTRTRSAEAVGGWLLESLEETPISPGLLEKLMARIECEPSPPPRAAAFASHGPVRLPDPLRSYVGGDLDKLKWRRLGTQAYQIAIKTADPETRVQLMRFPSGMVVPRHGHGGAELTLVLSGSLCDGGEVFERGDVQEADENVEHTPVAGPVEGCICLAVTDAPLRFKSLLIRLLQPLLGT